MQLPLRPAVGFALAASCAVAGIHAGDDRPLPLRLVVELVWGETVGPASFLADLERELLVELTRSGCFREVRRAPPETTDRDDVQLLIVVDDYNERTEFEFRLADRGAPDLDTDRLTVATIEAAYGLELRTLGGETPLRERRFTRRSSWRPIFHEDPREGARQQMIAEVARSTRRFACKGSPAWWSKQLERARSSR